MRVTDLKKASTAELLSALLHQALNLQQDGRGASQWDFRFRDDLLLIDSPVVGVTRQFLISGPQADELRPRLVLGLKIGTFPRGLVDVDVKEDSIRVLSSGAEDGFDFTFKSPRP
jgi:hypothetical protein